MKILQLTNKLPYPPKDGGAIATLNLAKGLADGGHKVTMLAMNTSKHYFDVSLIPAELKSIIDFKDVVVDIRINPLAAIANLFFSRLPYNAVRFFRKDYSAALEKLLLSEKFDVIQLEGLYLAWYIPLIRQNSDALIALRTHNIEHEIWHRQTHIEKNFLKRKYLKTLANRIRRFELSVINKYDLIVPITDRDADAFSKFGNNKPSITIPAGFDSSELKPSDNKVLFPSVFYIGTLDWFPNQDGLQWFLNKVWPLILEKYPGLTFHVAGRNAPLWLITLLNDARNVIYHGEVDDASEFINSYAIMVVPLFSGSGMRVKIIEGMALGKTIVTTTIGAEGINVEPGVNILMGDNPVNFAQHIVELVENRDYFENLGKNAYSFTKNSYDYRLLGEKISGFYQKLL